MTIKIGQAMVDDYSAMQGPAPSGYHIPSQDELSNLWSLVQSITGATTGNELSQYCLLPFAGYRSRGYAIASNQGSYGYYWSSSLSGNNARFLYFNESSVNFSNHYRAQARAVRCFKDRAVAPDSAWTVVYGALGGAGIFHNTAEGLISLSSDGENWTTIADKNLGATECYHPGDTLSESNCGGYYQWGNNYMFPFSGDVTTSSNQVDASGYGPGNYYYSDVFITGSSWDSSGNDNLWGEETGVVKRQVHLNVARIPWGVNREVEKIMFRGEEVFGLPPTPVTSAGIYHNTAEGLISLSTDGDTWITIADKNLGATTVYNYGDTLSESNCGGYYQWGNNYMFPFSGDVTTSSNKVDASGYGPGNYYYSDVFITGSSWDSSNNNNLWGDTTNTDEARQGPAPEGYHIPTDNEVSNLWSLVQSITGATTGNELSQYCLLPFAGRRSYSIASVYNQGSYGYYWSSSPRSASSNSTLSLYLNSSSVSAGINSSRGYGFSVRCFKNSPVQPTTEWNILYQPSN